MRILFLADMIGALERREAVAAIQYRDFLPLSLALARVPHGPLLGPTLLCTLIRDAGFEVELMQMAFRRQNESRLLEKLSSKPDVICITTTFILDDKALAKVIVLVKEHSPKTKIILGGPGLLANPAMRSLGDYCILGEGEENLVLLLQAIKTNTSVENIPGICFRDSSGKENMIPVGRLTPELDKIPFADWGLANRTKDEFYLLATQRGCAWRCAFCNYPALEGYKLRYRSTENVLQEMTLNFERYGIHRYMFADSTFTAPPERCLELLRGIARLPFRIEWAAFARVDTITPVLRDAMVDSGCVAVYLGIESGDQSILDKMKKNFTPEQARYSVKLLKEAGVRSTGSWILGWPGETPQSVRRTVDLAIELNCEQNNVNTFTITGLSPASLSPEKFQLLGSQTDWKHQSMSYQQALRWTNWAILKLMSHNVVIGSLFDYFWLTSVGLELNEIDEIFSKTQTLNAVSRKLKSHRGIDTVEIKSFLIKRCAEISRSAQNHPLYR
jgi:anaerobic magnesium-protoporphyrin IX monomethyl ester cyclase